MIGICHNKDNNSHYVEIILDIRRNLCLDEEIAKYLNISIIEYNLLQKAYGAYEHKISPLLGNLKNYYFDDKDDCKRFIDEVIEPYLIMKKLIGE